MFILTAGKVAKGLQVLSGTKNSPQIVKKYQFKWFQFNQS